MTLRLILGLKKGIKFSMKIYKENNLKYWSRMMQGADVHVSDVTRAMWPMSLLFSWFGENVRHYTMQVTYQSANINCSISVKICQTLMYKPSVLIGGIAFSIVTCFNYIINLFILGPDDPYNCFLFIDGRALQYGCQVRIKWYQFDKQPLRSRPCLL